MSSADGADESQSEPSPGSGGDQGEPVRATLEIRNSRGLHARASAKFVRCAEAFNAEISVSRDNQTVNATSIMGLMMLVAGPGSHIEVEATGREAREAVAALEALVTDRFGESV